jgi:hypothetical protein
VPAAGHALRDRVHGRGDPRHLSGDREGHGGVPLVHQLRDPLRRQQVELGEIGTGGLGGEVVELDSRIGT